jgi:hypothetical protein
MAKKTTEIKPKNAIVTIKAMKPVDWMKLIHDVESSYWFSYRVKIQIRGWILAGKPMALDAARAMIEAQAKKLKIEPTVEAIYEQNAAAKTDLEKEEMLEDVKDEGICEFHRRPDHPGIWLPSNNVKAGLKENWTAVGYTKAKVGSRSRLAETTFVRSVPPAGSSPVEWDWISLGDAPHPELHTAIAYIKGPQGPVTAIKRHEYVVNPIIEFDIVMSERAVKELPAKMLAGTLVHFSEHGLGACRSQGYGKFDILDMRGLGETNPPVTAEMG